MKDLIAATFVSNTKYYQYPIELWKQGLRDFETKVFECRKVQTPGDIAIIQNECLDELFKDYHNVLWVQADLIFLPKKRDLIINNLGKNICFGVKHIKRYYCQYISYHGCCLVANTRFLDDGAYTENCLIWSGKLCAIDVGYFGNKNYENHIEQQIRIWKQPVIRDNYLKDDIVEPDKQLKFVFDYFDLYDEYNLFLRDRKPK